MNLDVLTDEELIALKSGGFEALSDEALLRLKGGSPAESVPEPTTRDRVRMGVQGATLGFGDELTAGLAAIPAALSGDNYFDAYRDIRDAERADLDQYRENHAGEALALELGGGLATGGLSLGRQALQKGAQELLPRLWGNAKLGGKLGATAGLGYSEADNPLGMAWDTGVGGTIGSLTGVIAPEALTKSGQLAMDMLGRLGNRHAQRAKTLTGRKIGEALSRDELTPEQLAARRRKMGEAGTFADAGGENVRSLVDAAANVPGQARNRAKQFLDTRNRNQLGRIDDTLEMVFDTEDGFRNKFKSIVAARRQEAAPMYDELHKLPVDMPDDMIEYFMSKPSITAAKARANNLLKEEGFPPLDKDPYTWSMREWDFVKQGLVDHSQSVRQNLTGVGKGMSQEERLVRNTERELVDALDQQTGGKYREVLGMYSGHKRNEEALDLGRKFMSEDADYLDDMMEAMGPQEVEAFRIGALRAIRDKVGRTRSNVDAMAQFNTTRFQEQLQAILPDVRARAKFMRMMKNESEMTAVKNKITGGSPTQPRLATASDAMTDPNVPIAGMSGGPKAAALAVINNMVSKGKNMPEPVRNEVVDLLLNPQATNDDLMRILSGAEANTFPQMPGVVPGLLGYTSSYGVSNQ